jgi:hypothetical protein
VIIREIRPEDAAEWLVMRRELWPDGDDHDVEIAAFFAGSLDEPETVLVAEDGELLIGVAELSLRRDVAGSNGKLTGYVEGLFVRPAFRGRDVAWGLLRASQAWACGLVGLGVLRLLVIGLGGWSWIGGLAGADPCHGYPRARHLLDPAPSSGPEFYLFCIVDSVVVTITVAGMSLSSRYAAIARATSCGFRLSAGNGYSYLPLLYITGGFTLVSVALHLITMTRLACFPIASLSF